MLPMPIIRVAQGFVKRFALSDIGRFSCVPSMFDSLGVQVPYTT